MNQQTATGSILRPSWVSCLTRCPRRKRQGGPPVANGTSECFLGQWVTLGYKLVNTLLGGVSRVTFSTRKTVWEDERGSWLAWEQVTWGPSRRRIDEWRGSRNCRCKDNFKVNLLTLNLSHDRKHSGPMYHGSFAFSIRKTIGKANVTGENSWARGWHSHSGECIWQQIFAQQTKWKPKWEEEEKRRGDATQLARAGPVQSQSSCLS